MENKPIKKSQSSEFSNSLSSNNFSFEYESDNENSDKSFGEKLFNDKLFSDKLFNEKLFNEKLFNDKFFNIKEEDEPKSITTRFSNSSKQSLSYSTSTSRRTKLEKIPTLNSKISKMLKTKFLTIKDDGYIKKYYSEDHLDMNSDSIYSDTRTEFLDNRKVEDETLIKGIRKFNLRPKQGIDYFVQQRIIPEKTPKAVAEFLYQQCQNSEDKVNEHWQLDKKNVGLYLGDIDNFNVEVLDEFVKLHNFEGIQYDSALRIFLEEFFLPGESQIIDRMMQKFAYHYCDQNKNVFSCADTAYVLAFSIILLNTDLHNSRIKRKMTKEEFIRNNKGIDNGEDLPLDYLSYIYDNIFQNEIKSKTGEIELDTTKSITKILNDISYSFTNPNMEGWLYKRGGIGKKQWKKKWCLVANSCMYFFPNKNKEKTIGILPLCDLTVSKYEFESNSPTSNTQFLFNNIIKNFTKTRYYFIIKAKPKKEQEMMRKASSQNSPTDENIPNFAITDNNQKVLYSKHVNGKVIADIQDYYIFGVDTKEECEYWVYIIESQIHDSMAAYRSLAAVKRQSIIQRKDFNISSTDLLQYSSSEVSSDTHIMKDNYLYSLENSSNLPLHNNTLVNEKRLSNSIKSNSSKDKLNSSVTDSSDNTIENVNNSLYLPGRLSVGFSKINLSPGNEPDTGADAIGDTSIFRYLSRFSFITGHHEEEDEENEEAEESDYKSIFDDDDANNDDLGLAQPSKEKLLIPREFQRYYSNPDILSPIGISTSPDTGSEDSMLTASSASKSNASPEHEPSITSKDKSISEDFSFSIPTLSSIHIDSIIMDKDTSQEKDNGEEEEENIKEASEKEEQPPNYIYSSSNENNNQSIITRRLTNKSSCCDMTENIGLIENTIKETNESTNGMNNITAVEFNRCDIPPIPLQEKSFEELKFDEQHQFFEGQSQIPKTNINETQYINENDTLNILAGADLSSFKIK